jgi:hypothetical protein
VPEEGYEAKLQKAEAVKNIQAVLEQLLNHAMLHCRWHAFVEQIADLHAFSHKEETTCSSQHT